MIPIAKPTLGEREANAASEAILSGWVTQGPRVKKFEDAFAQDVGARHACAVSSCTAALHLALLAVGVRPGDVVITVSHSFIATANAVRHCGAEPVFIDIDPETYNMEPEELRRVLYEDCRTEEGKLYYNHIDKIAVGESPLKILCRSSNGSPSSIGRVAAVLPVHQMGIPCNIAQIVKIAKAHQLSVVEDAACAVGSEVSLDGGETWERIGHPHGDAACFSFHPRKILTTGDGGMITTNDSLMDARLRLLRHQGMNIPDTERHGSRKVIFEEYVTTGFNYRMTDIQAAVGIEQLKRLDGILLERRKLASGYADVMGSIPHLQLPKTPENTRPNWQSYPVKLGDMGSPGQTEVMQILLEKGIATRRGIMNAHQEPAYRPAGWVLPKSELSRDRVVLLPLAPGMTMKDLEYVSNMLREILTA